MNTKSMCWEDKTRLRPSTYVWKGRLLTCERWVITSADRRRACELERNNKGWTVDYFLFDYDACGSILSFSSLGSYDLRYRRIYASSADVCKEDVLGWVNEWRAPAHGIDGGILLCLDEWGNDVAV